MSDHCPEPLPTLETPRLILRAAVASDAERIQELFPNWNVLQYISASVPWPFPADGAAEFLAGLFPKIEAGTEYYWAITEKQDRYSKLIGAISLTPDAEKEHRGFWLGEPYWGRGYMKEANLVVNDFAFEVLGMSEMLLMNAQDNLASHRLKELAGASIVGIEEVDFVGGRMPAIRWRLTAEQWAENRHRFM